MLACSALKRSYRDAIRAQSPDTVFLHLDGSKEVLKARTEGRSGHFMPPSLLDSQLAALEPLQADEAGVVVDIAAQVNQAVTGALASLASKAARPGDPVMDLSGSYVRDSTVAPLNPADAAGRNEDRGRFIPTTMARPPVARAGSWRSINVAGK